MNLKLTQDYMQDQRIDGWLVHDFRGNNNVLARLLPGKRWTTRRAVLFIPAVGEPVLLSHGIDAQQFEKVAVRQEHYLSWRDLRAWLQKTLAGKGRIAMEYAPGATLPVVAIVDAGTVELVRSFGVDVVSSANLIQVCVARWSDEAVKSHEVASREVARIKDSAFDLIRARLASGTPVNEHEVQQHIMAGFKAANLETPEPPIVGVNEHSGNPHFEVSSTSPAPIRKGDWVLIDLWARQPGDQNIFSDITWVGFCGPTPSPRHREVFNTVKAARDASVKRAQDAWKNKQPVKGWQLDDAAMEVIIKGGFEKFIRHRTGHSLSAGPLVHGIGVNLDNLETHDTRDLIPGVGFTIEPGIYTPEFGVRLEINMHAHPEKGPIITSCVQDDILLLA